MKPPGTPVDRGGWKVARRIKWLGKWPTVVTIWVWVASWQIPTLNRVIVPILVIQAVLYFYGRHLEKGIIGGRYVP